MTGPADPGPEPGPPPADSSVPSTGSAEPAGFVVPPEPQRWPRRRILGAIGVVAAIIGAIGVKLLIGALAGGVVSAAIPTFFGEPWNKLPGDVRSAYIGRLQTAAGTRLDGLSETAREVLIDQWLRGGLLRLDDSRLARRLDLEVQALGSTDEATCAAFGRQSVTGIQMGQDARSKFLGALDQTSLVEWIGINVDAIEAELRGKPDPKRVDQAVVTAIIRKMAGGLAPAQIAVIGKMNANRAVADAEICDAIRGFYGAESVLDPEARATVARFNVQPSTASPSPSP